MAPKNRVIPSPDEESEVGTPTTGVASQSPRVIPSPGQATSNELDIGLDTSGEGNLLLDAWDSIKSFGSGVKQAATGEGVDLEFPSVSELTEIDDNSIGFWESFPVNLKLGLVRSDAKKAEILSDSFEGDKRFGGIFSDKFDNPMMVWNEQPYYINKPGLTGQDWTTFSGEILKYLPASKFVSGAKRLRGIIGRGVPAYTATEVAGSFGEAFLAPKATEAQQKGYYDIGEEAATVGGISAAVEAALPPVFRGAARVVKGAGAAATAALPPVIFPHLSRYAGRLSDAARKVLPTSFNQSSIYPLTQGQRGAGLPVGVTPRVTRQVEEEDIMRQAPSVAQTDATIMIRGFDDVQLEKISADARALQDEFGSGTMGEARGTIHVGGRVPVAATESAQDVVSRAAVDLKGRASEGYKAVRTAEVSPVMTPSGVVDTATRMRNAVFGKGEDSLGMTYAEIADMSTLAREAQYLNKVIKVYSKEKAPAVALTALHGIQKRLNRAINTAGAQTPEGLALTTMKRELDDSIYRGIDEGFMLGDETILKQLKESTALYRDYMRLTGKGRGRGPRARANAILEKLSDTDWDAPKLANMLFGHAKFNPAQSMRMVIDDFKSILPEDQYDEVMSYFKDAILEKAFTSPKGDVRRTAIINNYNDIFVKNKTIAEAIFSPEEIARIKQFRKNVLPTLWAEIKLNPSGSGYIALGGLARASLMSTGLRILAATPIVSEVGKAAQGWSAASFAREAITQYMRKNQTRWITIPSSAMTRTVIDEEIAPTTPVVAPDIRSLINSLSPKGIEKLQDIPQ
jgi:hypothetical protein